MSSERPRERDAVRTTIVGGRPPGSGKDVGEIPRGIEVLVSKASVDAEFRALLLERRADAAEGIGLTLSPTEAMMLDAIPEAHLDAVIARTKVAPANRRAFLGKAAAVMLAALGAIGLTAGCDTAGIEPDRPPKKDEEPPKPTPPAPTGIRPDRPPVSEGIRPDPPEKEAPPKPAEPVPSAGVRPSDVPVSRGVRPDRPPITKGVRPN